MGQTLGQRITAKREDEGKTQEELAAELGVAVGTLSRWENDHRVPDDRRKAYDRLMEWLDTE